MQIDGQKVRISLASTALDENAQNWVHEKSVAAVKGLDSKAEVEITFLEKRPVELNKIKNVIAIMSGKGGVGKSLVGGLTAIGINRDILSVFWMPILPVPVFPRCLVFTRPGGSDTGILPLSSESVLK